MLRKRKIVAVRFNNSLAALKKAGIVPPVILVFCSRGFLLQGKIGIANN